MFVKFVHEQLYLCSSNVNMCKILSTFWSKVKYHTHILRTVLWQFAFNVYRTVSIVPFVLTCWNIFIKKNIKILTILKIETTNRPLWDCKHNCISHPFIVHFVINNIWPEFTELLDTRQITIHEFHWIEWTDHRYRDIDMFCTVY